MSIHTYKKGKLVSYRDGLTQTHSHRILREEVMKVLKEYELGMGEWTILCMLFDKESMRLTEIASTLDVEPPHVTNLVEILLKQKLVKRLIDSEDKRAKVVSLTDRTKKLLPEIENQVVERMKALLNGITEDELDTYFKVQQTIISNYQK
jgi:DNA-binding MarR family transcriptional regulator